MEKIAVTICDLIFNDFPKYKKKQGVSNSNYLTRVIWFHLCFETKKNICMCILVMMMMMINNNIL